MSDDKVETYVLGDTEVKKTGRTAERAAPGGKTLVLVEVTPVDKDVGTWLKWVTPGSLFTIK